MRQQSFPVDHAVYINSDESLKQNRSTNYIPLLEDLCVGPTQLLLDFGPSLHQHYNYMRAIELVDTANYDLFVKIDDDDIYGLNYVAGVVDDFIEHRWDMSGSACYSQLNGYYWIHHPARKSIDPRNQRNIGMSPTFAFSRPAIDELRSLQVSFSNHDYEDNIWQQHLGDNNALQITAA